MFSRHKKQSLLDRIFNNIWPCMGLQRFSKYILCRLARLRTSRYAVAAGFACGACMSFTPFLGIHILSSVIFAFCIRASIVASIIGTFIGNPLTFPLIWFVTYKTGALMLGISNHADVAYLLSHASDILIKINDWNIKTLTYSTGDLAPFGTYMGYWKQLGSLLYPLAIGSIPWVIIIWFTFFLLLLKLQSGFIFRKKINRTP